MPEQVGDVSEQYQYRGVSISSGIPTRTRGFRVVKTTIDPALNATGVPKFLDEHPDFSNMVAKDITAIWKGKDTHVVVTYVLKAYAGQIPAVDEFSENFVGIDLTFDEVLIDIPLYQQTKIKIGNPPDVIEKLVWQRRTDVMKYLYNHTVLRIDIALELDTQSNFYVATALGDLITDQANKIHTLPNGKKYLFKPEGLDQNGPKQFKATYRWINDPGVPNVLKGKFGGVFANRKLQIIGGTGYPVFSDEIMIPPWNGIRIDGNQDDPSTAPEVTFFDRFLEDKDGWKNLPGML